MAAEAPYRVPAQLDLSLVESLLAAKASAAEDHLWALREDPDYFSRTLHEAKDHRQETLKDLNGNTHPLLSRDRSQFLWAHIIGSVVSKAYLDLELFTELSSQARKLVLLQRQYAEDISPARDLPEEYLEGLLRFRFYLTHGVAEPLSNLKYAVVASNPLRRYFARLPSPDAHSRNISIVFKSGFKVGKVEERLIWLLGVLSEDDPFLISAGMSLIVDELERLLQSDPKVRDLFSSYVTTVIGDISIISQCLHQLDIYYPWARGFEGELVNREDRFREDYRERTTPWAQILAGLHDTTSLEQAANLGEPSAGKFTYPVEKRRSKESVEALRSAESHLHAFWAAVDQIMIAKTDKLKDTAVANLLSQRILQRTPDWVELIKPSTAETTETTDNQGKGKADAYFSYHATSGVSSEIPAKPLDVTKPKTKVKTRGIPQTPTGAIEAEILTPPNPTNYQPTFFVDARALKVFHTILFNPTVTSSPGEVPWNDFLHAMTSVGFMAMKLYGSVWQFQLTRLNVERNIQFHEPHLRGKLPFRVARLYGRRINRAYGWFGGMFSLAKK